MGSLGSSLCPLYPAAPSPLPQYLLEYSRAFPRMAEISRPSCLAHAHGLFPYPETLVKAFCKGPAPTSRLGKLPGVSCQAPNAVGSPFPSSAALGSLAW